MIDVGSWIILITFFVIFLVFLFFDIFKRGEPYGNLAYITAVIPCTYLWYQVTAPGNLIHYRDFGVTGVWTILMGLWLITMVRDMILVKVKKKDFDDVILYMVIAILIQFIISAVLPNTIVEMKAGTSEVWFFWLPNLADPSVTSALFFKLMVTLLVISVAIPMILDLRGENVNMWILVIITAIFALPFGLVCYLWLPDYAWALLLLVMVLFFIILLMLTRGENEN
jgi:hypothetical protein